MFVAEVCYCLQKVKQTFLAIIPQPCIYKRSPVAELQEKQVLVVMPILKIF